MALRLFFVVFLGDLLFLTVVTGLAWMEGGREGWRESNIGWFGWLAG